MSDDEKMREAFEHRFSDGGQAPKAIERGSDGNYLLLSACIAWVDWRAAWTAATAQAEVDRHGGLMFTIKDKPGTISVSRMNAAFEKVIADTSAFSANTPLDAVTINGKFSHYMNSDTDTMWLGFALGMRAAERLALASTGEGQS